MAVAKTDPTLRRNRLGRMPTSRPVQAISAVPIHQGSMWAPTLSSGVVRLLRASRELADGIARPLPVSQRGA